jgi:hypothetical protein
MNKSFLLLFFKNKALAFLLAGRQSKRFFFEKKKQKTFVHSAAESRGG